jgi:hypothetical protein
MSKGFDLLVTVVCGQVIGGGLNRSAYVETYFNGQLFDTTETAAPRTIVNGTIEWNQRLYRSIEDGYFASQSVLSFAVYKKRWTSQGFKLVGTLDIPLVRLIPDLDNGLIQQCHPLKSATKNVTMTGSLTLALELKETVAFAISQVPTHPQHPPLEGSHYILSQGQSFIDRNKSRPRHQSFDEDQSLYTAGSLKTNSSPDHSFISDEMEEESMETTLLTASCYCKKVKIMTTSVPHKVLYCHCINCQTFSGGPYVLKYQFYSSDCSLNYSECITRCTGRKVVHRCTDCLCAVFETDGTSTFIGHGVLDRSESNTALLENPTYKPSKHVYYDSRFVDVKDNLPKYSGDEFSGLS